MRFKISSNQSFKVVAFQNQLTSTFQKKTNHCFKTTDLFLRLYLRFPRSPPHHTSDGKFVAFNSPKSILPYRCPRTHTHRYHSLGPTGHNDLLIRQPLPSLMFTQTWPCLNFKNIDLISSFKLIHLADNDSDDADVHLSQEKGSPAPPPSSCTHTLTPSCMLSFGCANVCVCVCAPTTEQTVLSETSFRHRASIHHSTKKS